MYEIMIYSGVEAASEVWSGFSGIKLQAPSEPGTYRLFEVVESGNTHAGWRWEKE